MRKQWVRAALMAAVASAWALPASAANTETYKIPYLGVAAEYGKTDSARQAGNIGGFQLSVGVPLSQQNQAVELRFFDSAIKKRFPDDKKDYQSGLFADYVYDFGPQGETGDGFFRYFKPYVAGGVGFIQEDVQSHKHTHFGLAAGGGVLAPIGFKGWALRLDARVQPQSNSQSVSKANFFPEDKNYLIDYVVTLGVQIPLTIFFDRPQPVEPAGDCPVAVVDPATGRRDCAGDGDGDGVPDGKDQCPGTPAGTVVDEKGCPKAAEVSNDDDRDGVPNSRDQCPGTQQGLLVDDRGCVVSQKTAIQGVTFLENSSKLTAEGKRTLDGVAETLKQQPKLKVEIAGHTDNVGSDAYNQLLSQQRAEAVRAYLVEKGVAGERMTAMGYGEAEPLGTNDSEEGRNANRRVEFRITAAD